jgi:hypothetical protein
MSDYQIYQLNNIIYKILPICYIILIWGTILYIMFPSISWVKKLGLILLWIASIVSTITLIIFILIN